MSPPPEPAWSQTPPEGRPWDLRSPAGGIDPSLKLPAASAWASGASTLQLGEVKVNNPAKSWEGLGRASPSSRRSSGVRECHTETMQLTPAEAFVLRTAARQLRDAGLGVDLPGSLGWPADSASQSGGTARTIERFHPGESLSWSI